MKPEQLTLEQKVGQLFALTHKGPEMSEQSRQLIQEKQIGGIFLNIDSLRTPEQVHRLTSELQQAALQSGPGIPLFISADFVAGAGCKLQGGAVHFPKNRAIGAAGDEKLAYEAGTITALESLAMGVNFNYSPVVDINNNPRNPVIGTHSFGDDRELVARLGAAAIRGYQDNGLIATAKHFPGHGDTQVDSHYDLPVLEFDRQRLEQFELYPFRRAISAGVEAVMVGHIAVPALDPSGKPASLSYAVTTEWLRNRMGFRGMIVTDGLSMKGITNTYTMEEACVLALEAGADILLATARSHEEALSMVDAVLGAVRSGRLPERRIDESVRRILDTKRKYGLAPESFRIRPFQPDALNAPEFHAVSLNIARRAVRTVGSVPAGLSGEFKSAPWILVRDKSLDRFAALWRSAAADTAEEKIMDGPEDLTNLPEWVRPDDPRPVLLAVHHNKPLDDRLLRSIRELRERDPDRTFYLIHFGSPYDFLSLPGISGLSLADKAPSLQQAAFEALLGHNITDI
ncbi:glycoside hydrolase family 3 protein [Paenibacillus thermoaerophilus]|uniref:beta-N-acetylhexosaminidase n=1 Tax=Paenibacillus thermoaerophilus TaxID=1215385 RepID=A0ABW2V278_9BACL|nr:glycoside hydrolase family 3 N-terminal domain-containing protein [Paenibacillus thermoaerophilus]TMV11170.1 hypothetical protein FE781_12890 [Paenibacillus thermoaerophilus]